MIFYDTETFLFDWMVVFNDPINKEETVIVNDTKRLKEFYETHKNEIWVGYNSRNYDQYIIKGILLGFNPKQINDFIIEEGRKGWEYSDAFKDIPLHNYDVFTGFNGLKVLEGFMGSDIRESSVPFNIRRPLKPNEIAETIEYCRHDVNQTILVFCRRLQEFTSYLGLVNQFNLPLSYMNKTKPQLSANILGAERKSHYGSEFDLTLPDTLRISKYAHIVDWYRQKENRNYKKFLEIDVAGVPHLFGWGGLHGALEKYFGEGLFVHIDVDSYYPNLMIEYNFMSRCVRGTKLYKDILDRRMEFKRAHDERQEPLKIVLNSTYGAMKDRYNPLYDPRQANNVCVGGQLLLLDLIEHLEGCCKLIQSNTDGIIVKYDKPEDLEVIKEICHEWENRTRLHLGFTEITKIWQRDVNNYLAVTKSGELKSKGADVKKLKPLDNNLAIVNKAIKAYLIDGVLPEVTIRDSNDLIDYQMIVTVKGDYLFAVHEEMGELKKLDGKTHRVFASLNNSDGAISRTKNATSQQMSLFSSVAVDRGHKFAGTPNNCFIMNENIVGKQCVPHLDKQWYVDEVYRRLVMWGIFND